VVVSVKEESMFGLYKFYPKLGSCHPKLGREQVWCLKCGRTEKVDSAECFRSGWPKCCGETMTIDNPEERKDG
jgi:hypothetical protein